MPYTSLDPATAQASGLTIGAPLVGTGDGSLVDLRAKLLLRLGDRDDVTTAEIDGWINDAYRQICSEIPFEELETEVTISTLIGQHLYKLPVNTHTLRTASITVTGDVYGGYPLEKIDREAYRRGSNVPGYPTAFFRYQSCIVLYPTPSAVYSFSLSLRAKPGLLTADNHKPVIDPEWYLALVLLAESISRDALGEKDQAGVALNKYLATVRSKISKSSQEHEGTQATMSVPRRRADLSRDGRRRAWEDWL